jgi:hypothetical protein
MSTHPPDDLLAAAVDGTLSPADRREVEAHLRTCSGCRGDVAAAGRARDALGALPDQLVPPVDVAAAVAGAAAGAGAGAPQRWYRAAALVAAAAAIALAVLVIPDLTNDGGSQETTAAVGAAPQEAGVSAADGSASPVPFAGVPSLEVVGIDFDHASLAALAQQGGAAFEPARPARSPPMRASSACWPPRSGERPPTSGSSPRVRRTIRRGSWSWPWQRTAAGCSTRPDILVSPPGIGAR